MASKKLSVFAFILIVVAALPAIFAQEGGLAPSPSMESGSSFVIPALGAIISASLLSFLALLAQ
ncbi:hypothetical protein AMTRI_Chr03g45160 [Amborella trichopoda]